MLAAVASGESNKDIGRRLGYSAHYVKEVIAAARRELGARDRAHAAAMAVARGLVEEDGRGTFSPAM